MAANIWTLLVFNLIGLVWSTSYTLYRTISLHLGYEGSYWVATMISLLGDLGEKAVSLTSFSIYAVIYFRQL
jgi:hypothetical protein